MLERMCKKICQEYVFTKAFLSNYELCRGSFSLHHNRFQDDICLKGCEDMVFFSPLLCILLFIYGHGYSANKHWKVLKSLSVWGHPSNCLCCCKFDNLWHTIALFSVPIDGDGLVLVQCTQGSCGYNCSFQYTLCAFDFTSVVTLIIVYCLHLMFSFFFIICLKSEALLQFLVLFL